MIRIDVEYTGRVQNVGFRYTTTNIAARFAVAGYVQNLSHGGVRLVAEGEKADVEEFLDLLSLEHGHALSPSPGNELLLSGRYA